MTRDQKIADLVLHGYVPHRNTFGWAIIYSDERGEGRICKKFDKGWDVRAIKFLLPGHSEEVSWGEISDGELGQLLLEEVPPKYQHAMVPIGLVP